MNVLRTFNVGRLSTGWISLRKKLIEKTVFVCNQPKNNHIAGNNELSEPIWQEKATCSSPNTISYSSNKTNPPSSEKNISVNKDPERNHHNNINYTFTLISSTLIYFTPRFHFYIPWKRQKAKGFLAFSGGIAIEHRREIG